MHIDELRSRFGLSRRTIWEYSHRGIIPPPRGKTRNATYGPEHVAAITAYRALKDFNTYQRELALILRENQIDIVEFVRQRTQYVKDHGLSANAGSL